MATAEGRKTSYGKAKEFMAHGVLEAMEVWRRIPNHADRNDAMQAINDVADAWGRFCDIVDKHELMDD